LQGCASSNIGAELKEARCREALERGSAIIIAASIGEQNHKLDSIHAHCSKLLFLRKGLHAFENLFEMDELQLSTKLTSTQELLA
jgi:isocitrate/isopropylmalate dehydrogenase